MRVMRRLLATATLLIVQVLAYADQSPTPTPEEQPPPPERRAIAGAARYQETGEGIVGAFISVKGTTISTLAGSDGSFLLKNVPAGTVTLIVLEPGGFQKEVTVAGDQKSGRSCRARR